jgi:UDP-glucose 4-epimerase
MKRYLVTGAAGFIGSAVARRLLKDGHEVWTIDNLSTGSRENLPSDVTLIQGDCQNPDIIRKLGDTQFYAVIHMAGQSSGEISFQDPVYDLASNVESTLRLIQYGLGTGCRRFVYASSMSVYGDVPDRPISEDHETRPLSFYGVGKLASENYLRLYQARGLKPTVLRFFNVYGPNQNMRNLRQGMVSIYLAQLLQNDTVVVKGAPTRFRDFLYIEDAVEAVITILDDERAYGGIYNVATGVRTTVKELLEKLLAVCGNHKRIVFTEGTPGDQQGIFADVSLIKERFGFESRYSLDQGLSEMVEWAKMSSW